MWFHQYVEFKKQNKDKKDKWKNRLLTIENKLLVTRGKVDGGMDEIGEGGQGHTYRDEHWIMYRIVESLYWAPDTNITL